MGTIFHFAFSSFLNFVVTVLLIHGIVSVFNVYSFKSDKKNGRTTVKDYKMGPTYSIDERISKSKKSAIISLVLVIFIYFFANGAKTPSEVADLDRVAMQEYQKQKEQEKIQKEERKKQEKLAEEKKEAEEKAEKERLKQEKIAAERQAKLDAENADKSNHDFIEISAVALMNELESNAARTKNNFDNRYVKITNGTVTNIESDGDYVTLNGYSLANIQCFPKYQSTREQIFALNNGQHITVYGKITHVGEIAGFSLELLKIE